MDNQMVNRVPWWQKRYLLCIACHFRKGDMCSATGGKGNPRVPSGVWESRCLPASLWNPAQCQSTLLRSHRAKWPVNDPLGASSPPSTPGNTEPNSPGSGPGETEDPRPRPLCPPTPGSQVSLSPPLPHSVPGHIVGKVIPALRGPTPSLTLVKWPPGQTAGLEAKDGGQGTASQSGGCTAGVAVRLRTAGWTGCGPRGHHNGSHLDMLTSSQNPGPGWHCQPAHPALCAAQARLVASGC